MGKPVWDHTDPHAVSTCSGCARVTKARRANCQVEAGQAATKKSLGRCDMKRQQPEGTAGAVSPAVLWAVIPQALLSLMKGANGDQRPRGQAIAPRTRTGYKPHVGICIRVVGELS